MHRIEVDMTKDEALAFAIFLRRVTHEDYERLSDHEGEANAMHEAALSMQAALGYAGFSPPAHRIDQLSEFGEELILIETGY